jgi:hypothetical protein
MSIRRWGYPAKEKVKIGAPVVRDRLRQSPRWKRLDPIVDRPAPLEN